MTSSAGKDCEQRLRSPLWRLKRTNHRTWLDTGVGIQRTNPPAPSTGINKLLNIDYNQRKVHRWSGSVWICLAPPPGQTAPCQ